MDLNELLHAHQLEVMKASSSGDDNHFERIAEYADRIRKLRKVSPANAAVQDPAAPPTIIYGSYAGPTAFEDEASIVPSPAKGFAGAESENPDRGRADAGRAQSALPTIPKKPN